MAETATHPLIGKPLVLYAKGKRRVVGRVTDVDIVDGELQFRGKITDAPVADLLGLPPDEELRGVLPDGQP